MLAVLKASAQPRERQVAACMIHNLFDEYRFYAKYPDKELAITATLFGGLVQQGLVTGRWLDLSLRYMLVCAGFEAGFTCRCTALQL